MKFEKSFLSLAHLNPCHLFGWLHFFSWFKKHQSLVLELKEKNIISKVLNTFLQLKLIYGWQSGEEEICIQLMKFSKRNNRSPKDDLPPSKS